MHFHFQLPREGLGLPSEVLGFPTMGEVPHRALRGFMPTLPQAPTNSLRLLPTLSGISKHTSDLAEKRRSSSAFLPHPPKACDQDVKPPGERQSFSHAVVPFDFPHCPPESSVLRRSRSTSSPAPFGPCSRQVSTSMLQHRRLSCQGSSQSHCP